MLLQLACDLCLYVLLHLLSSVGLRLLAHVVLLLKIAFERRNSHQSGLKLVLQVIIIRRDN